MRPIKHGTYSAYTNSRCRCDDCREAGHDYERARRGSKNIDRIDRRSLIGDLLHELCPDGLTDDAPVRRAKRAAQQKQAA